MFPLEIIAFDAVRIEDSRWQKVTAGSFAAPYEYMETRLKEGNCKADSMRFYLHLFVLVT